MGGNWWGNYRLERKQWEFEKQSQCKLMGLFEGDFAKSEERQGVRNRKGAAGQGISKDELKAWEFQ